MSADIVPSSANLWRGDPSRHAVLWAILLWGGWLANFAKSVVGTTDTKLPTPVGDGRCDKRNAQPELKKDEAGKCLLPHGWVRCGIARVGCTRVCTYCTCAPSADPARCRRCTLDCWRGSGVSPWIALNQGRLLTGRAAWESPRGHSSPSFVCLADGLAPRIGHLATQRNSAASGLEAGCLNR